MAARISAAQNFPPGFFSTDRIEQGRELATTVCATCHLLPDPGILDRNTWLNGAMPWMMMVMGLSPAAVPAGLEGELIRKSGAVASAPIISKDQFGKILAYYLQSAPEALPLSAKPPVIQEGLFKARPLVAGSAMASAVLVKIASDGTVLWGDGHSNALRRINAGGVELDQTSFPSAPVDVFETDTGHYVTCIGGLSPSEQSRGGLYWLPLDEGKFGRAAAILSHLHRPTHCNVASPDSRGRRSFLVSMFGWYSGRLSWFEEQEPGAFEEHPLFEKPGTLKTEVRDFDGDGAPDIMALHAQAHESLVIYYNRGSGKFEPRTVFQKDPSFGHTSFDLADFNGDGHLDIIATNGDSGDYPSPPRPYHGIRIHLNNGSGQFEEKLFWPFPGASKAMARDFDGDGDLDVAAISYYPDFRRSEHGGFLYLENKGALRFEASTFATSDAGRWATMDAGDVDRDGDVDIVLGSVWQGPGKTDYVPSALTKRWQQEGVVLMLLENSRR